MDDERSTTKSVGRGLDVITTSKRVWVVGTSNVRAPLQSILVHMFILLKSITLYDLSQSYFSNLNISTSPPVSTPVPSTLLKFNLLRSLPLWTLSSHSLSLFTFKFRELPDFLPVARTRIICTIPHHPSLYPLHLFQSVYSLNLN